MIRHSASCFSLFALLTLAIISFSAYRKNAAVAGYNFSQPATVLSLPDTLREISALTAIDNRYVACVQDENGIVFIYDLEKNAIQRQLSFAANGDYEDITRVGKTIYVLRSDGMLFKIADFTAAKVQADSIPTGIPAYNSEGLCFDAENKRLLIACKSPIDKTYEHKYKRMVYAFDLKTQQCLPEPVYTFEVPVLKAFASEHRVNLPMRVKKHPQTQVETSEPILKLKPSAIAIHPVTKNVFLLSASDHLLFIFSPAGVIEHIEVLHPVVFNKAEGITFLPSGELLISNEGKEQPATILRFNYNAAPPLEKAQE